MIMIQFHARDKFTGEDMRSTKAFFDSYNEEAQQLIDLNYKILKSQLHNSRIVCLISQVEDDILNLDTRR